MLMDTMIVRKYSVLYFQPWSAIRTRLLGLFGWNCFYLSQISDDKAYLSNCKLCFRLQVTSLLLEGERRKLAVLQRELQVALAEGGSVKVKEKQKLELLHAIS